VCAWPDVVRTLLAGPNGIVRLELEPVAAALCAVNARTGLHWVARARTRTMLSTLAVGTGPVTHAVLDQLEPAAAAMHLRAILVESGVLAPRDERLEALEQAVKRRIARVADPAERKLLQSFATWHHLRRLRTIVARRSITQDQAVYASNSLTAAAALLTRLRERGRSLATCTQDDIDDWLTIDTFGRARGFVTWALARGHAHGIAIPRFRNDPSREVFAEHEQRWALARQLLNDDTIALTDRIAGLLVLLYAQRAVTITRLTIQHVTIDEDHVQLRLGSQPITVPPVLGDLLVTLVRERATANAVSPNNNWLYPALRLGQPLAPRILQRRLQAIGIPATIGRNSALMELAAEMPAAVLSGLLGISVDRATHWTQDASNTRPGYAAELARRIQIAGSNRL
jgi:hypothetical protein